MKEASVTDLRQETGPLNQPAPGRDRRLWRALIADRRVRYVAVGGVSAVVYYAIFTAGYLLLGEWISPTAGFSAVVVAVFANLATALLMYPLYRVGVFAGEGPWLSGFLRFYTIALWSLLWSLVGLPLLIELAGMHPLLAQGIIIVAVPLLNYQIHIFWTFRHRPSP